MFVSSGPVVSGTGFGGLDELPRAALPGLPCRGLTVVLSRRWRTLKGAYAGGQPGSDPAIGCLLVSGHGPGFPPPRR